MNFNENLIVENKQYKIYYDQVKKILLIQNTLWRQSAKIEMPTGIKSLKQHLIRNDLIIYQEKGCPKLYRYSQNKVFNIRKYLSGDLTICGDDFLVRFDGTLYEVWHLHNDEFCKFNYAGDFDRPDLIDKHSCAVISEKSGAKTLVLHNRRIRLNTVSCFQVYPINISIQNQHDKQDKCKENDPDVILDNEAYSCSKRYKITYSIDASFFDIYEQDKNGDYKLIYEKLDKHSCSIRSIIFPNSDLNFISYDTGGKLKIWNINDGSLSVLQTLNSREFINENYSNIEFDKENNHLRFICVNEIDIYELRYDGLKKKGRNQLLFYLKTENKPVPLKVVISQGIIQPVAPLCLANKSDIKPIISQKTKLDINTSQREKVIIKDGWDTFTITKPGSIFGKKPVSIYVGIDFGTSRTKVSFQNGTRDLNKYEPVYFYQDEVKLHDDKMQYEKYIIPSIVGIKGNDVIYGFDTIMEKNIKRVEYLKQSVLQNDNSDNRLLLTAGFLAYLFHKSKLKVLERLKQIKDDENVRFKYSICLPVEQMNNNATVKQFRKIMSFAETIYENNAWSDLGLMSQIYSEGKSPYLNKYTHVVPESIAELLDFIKKIDNDKLYALYDFGAGTTDLTIFKPESHHELVNIFEAKIVYKGYSKIDQIALKKKNLRLDITEWYKEIWDEFDRSGVWGRAYKKIIESGSLQRWKELTILTSGGAANDQIIQKLFTEIPLHEHRGENLVCAMVPLKEPINWPHDFPAYNRFAVSFGLTYNPIETLRKYKLPKDCRTFKYKDKMKIIEYKDPDDRIPNPDW